MLICSVCGVMLRYVSLCGAMWRYVALCGGMWPHVANFAVIRRYVA